MRSVQVDFVDLVNLSFGGIEVTTKFWINENKTKNYASYQI